MDGEKIIEAKKRTEPGTARFASAVDGEIWREILKLKIIIPPYSVQNIGRW